jgi:sulfide:quinone oxidoreductase
VFTDGGGVVTERIAARLAGREPEVLFDGQGACWLEVGGGEAMVIGLAPGRARAGHRARRSSPGHLEEKARYERERLEAWFGPE